VSFIFRLKETLGQEAPIDTKKKIDQVKIDKMRVILKVKRQLRS